MELSENRFFAVVRKSFLLIFCIFIVELSKAVFVLFLPSQRSSVVLFFIFYFLQIISAPIQGAFSDKYCRKNCLIVALAFIILSQISIVLSHRLTNEFYRMLLLVLGIVFYGTLGNASVIARAGIIDLFSTSKVEHRHPIKIAISLTFFVLPIAWIIIAFSRIHFSDISLFLALAPVTIVCIMFTAIHFEDRRDYDKHEKVKPLLHFINAEHFGLGFLGLYLTQIAFQLAYLFQDDNIPRRLENYYTIGFAFGMLLGIIIQTISKKKDKYFILSGIRHSAFALILLMVLYYLGLESRFVIAISIMIYFYFTMGSGYYLPRFYNLYSKGHLPHEQGKLFGLLDSISTLGEVSAVTILFLKLKEVPLISFSIIIFTFAYLILKWKLAHIEAKINN